MKPLNRRQSDLAADHVGLVEQVASGIRTQLLSRDEARSAAAIGLVEAAARWRRRRGPFAPFARLLMRRRIYREWLPIVRRPTVPLAIDPPAREDGRASPELREEAAQVVAILPTLPPRQREALELYAAGHAWREVAAIMGIRRDTVEYHRARAARAVRRRLLGSGTQAR